MPCTAKFVFDITTQNFSINCKYRIYRLKYKSINEQ